MTSSLQGVRLRATEPRRDASDLHAVMGDEASCRYLSHPPLASVTETEAKLAEWVSLAPEHDWAIMLAGDSRTAGRVTIFRREDGNWEAGIIVCPWARGKGVAFKALTQGIDLLDHDKPPRRIIADIDPDNAPSIALFAKLGFVNEGVLRANWETHIGVRDSVIMSLIANDKRVWREGSE